MNKSDPYKSMREMNDLAARVMQDQRPLGRKETRDLFASICESLDRIEAKLDSLLRRQGEEE